MKRISREQTTGIFGPDVPPVAEVAPGETLAFETWDALGGRVKTHADALTVLLSPGQVNPATGPVFVQGAQPGDTLAVSILDIELGERGQTRFKVGSGVLAGEVNAPSAALVPVRDGIAYFSDRIHFPVRPMVGVIGTAPAGQSVESAYPGPHGGNLDINEIGVGSTVYLPVAVPGALLAIGDVHAFMGDGELTGGGIDICAAVTVQVKLHQGIGWQRPVVETSEAWCTCANAPSLAEAIRIATRDMVALLSGRLSISKEEGFLLVGAAADARIGQAAQLGMDVTAYLRISKLILSRAF